MQAQPRHGYRAADLVISGVVDVLQVEGKEHTAPDVRGVEHFLDGFAAVRESAIAQNESQAPVGQICLMRFRDAARYERGSGAVEAAMPARALYIHAQLYAFVIFGVGERLMFPFVPSPAPEGPNVSREFLLEVNSEAVFDRSLFSRSRDIRRRRDVIEIELHRFLIVAYVGVVDVIKKAYGRVLVLEQLRTQFQLDVFGASAGNIGVEVRPIRNLWHQDFCKTQSPIAVLVIEYRSNRVAAGIGGIIPSTVVGDDPVQKLVVAVGAANVEVEEIRESELAKANFQPPHRNLSWKRQGRPLHFHLLLRQRNDLLDHHPRDVGRGSDGRITDNVEVGEASQPQRGA